MGIPDLLTREFILKLTRTFPKANPIYFGDYDIFGKLIFPFNRISHITILISLFHNMACSFFGVANIFSLYKYGNTVANQWEPITDTHLAITNLKWGLRSTALSLRGAVPLSELDHARIRTAVTIHKKKKHEDVVALLVGIKTTGKKILLNNIAISELYNIVKNKLVDNVGSSE